MYPANFVWVRAPPGTKNGSQNGPPDSGFLFKKQIGGAENGVHFGTPDSVRRGPAEEVAGGGQSFSVLDMCRAVLVALQTLLSVEKIMQSSYSQPGYMHFEFVTVAAVTAGCMRTSGKPGLTFLRCRGLGLLYFAVFFFVYLDGTACYRLWVLLLREHCGLNAHSQVTFLLPLSALLSAFQVHRKRFPANAACPVISETLIA